MCVHYRVRSRCPDCIADEMKGVAQQLPRGQGWNIKRAGLESDGDASSPPKDGSRKDFRLDASGQKTGGPKSSENGRPETEFSSAAMGSVGEQAAGSEAEMKQQLEMLRAQQAQAFRCVSSTPGHTRAGSRREVATGAQQHHARQVPMSKGDLTVCADFGICAAVHISPTRQKCSQKSAGCMLRIENSGRCLQLAAGLRCRCSRPFILGPRFQAHRQWRLWSSPRSLRARLRRRHDSISPVRMVMGRQRTQRGRGLTDKELQARR